MPFDATDTLARGILLRLRSYCIFNAFCSLVQDSFENRHYMYWTIRHRFLFLDLKNQNNCFIIVRVMQAFQLLLFVTLCLQRGGASCHTQSHGTNRNHEQMMCC